MVPDLAGKRVLVIGGATGIGGAASRAFAAAGARVCIHWHEGAAEAESLLAELEDGGAAVCGRTADLMRPGAAAALVDA
ncbi:MAG: SDR family NAD(P)-dependent oxidoreductase, partial [Alphaproteobacteria bacterium]|nr:SDR family NAD(P)-dependent oxidoreductase [Alphaproteobacteria bacterium]